MYRAAILILILILTLICLLRHADGMHADALAASATQTSGIGSQEEEQLARPTTLSSLRLYSELRDQ
jgi:hypothetical protein